VNEAWVEDVLTFWLQEVPSQSWFSRDERLDARIRARFLELYTGLLDVPECAFSSARASLAAVIVFDQFPRNMFRGEPRAFATDAKALSIAMRAIEEGHDRELGADERMFLYMPLQHAEDAAVQGKSIELYSTLGKEEVLRYARAHKDVVDRFGRFPHRNAVLGRASTAEEIEFVRTHRGF
jgi:uncharacterized protein (DUF924 family)